MDEEGNELNIVKLYHEVGVKLDDECSFYWNSLFFLYIKEITGMNAFVELNQAK